ncbi:LemA family protein [Secundilactobacillus oryzae]|nr:LemA family protein [Secundilactobacillus oryzae]
MTWLIVIVIVALIAIIYVVQYNGLIKMRTYVEESWSQIDVQLKRRNDLIPNLISTVKGYANFEQETLAKVTSLRNQMANVPAGDRQKTMAVSNELSGAMSSFFAVAENYPTLKADAQFTKLMEELANTENKIAYSRQLYNTSVANLNLKIQSFPSNIVAGIHHFKQGDYLQVPEEEKENPTVNFDEFKGFDK